MKRWQGGWRSSDEAHKMADDIVTFVEIGCSIGQNKLFSVMRDVEFCNRCYGLFHKTTEDCRRGRE